MRPHTGTSGLSSVLTERRLRMAALLILARSVLAAVLGGAALAHVAGDAGLGPLSLGGGGGFDIFGGGPAHRRRRRRRALTASDKADIAFISGTLGKPAGRDFAMVVAARN